MKSATLALGLTSALLAASASAYGTATHSEISREAVNRSTLNSRIWNLGASVGLTTIDSPISDGGFYFFGLILFENSMSAMDWIRYGAVKEDSFYGLRFRNHFYNPIAPPGQEGYHYGPIVGTPSLVWGLEQTENFWQDYSYRDAKEYIYQGVLAPTERERKQSLAALLRTVGQVIHLLQDLSQPQHTRNDSHGTGSGYETFNNERLSDLPFGNYPAVRFDTPESYWSTPDGRGLANYTNRGFITAGTNFTGTRTGNELIVHPNPLFPSPGGASTEEDRLQITDLLGPPGPGQPLIGEIWFVRNSVTDSLQGMTDTNLRASTFSIFDEDLAAMGFSWTFSVNRFTYESARELLIPRAVGYSAGMIDRIFRGKLTIGPPQIGAYAVADHASAQGFQEIKATVTNTTEGEAMSGGTLIAVAKYHHNECYQPDLSGEFTLDDNGSLIAPCPRYRSAEESMSVATAQTLSLESGEQVELTFSFDPPIPMDATDLYLQVVYRGQLGTEQDGIAVGMRDLAEPTYLSIFNATDAFVLPSATGGQFHYYQDIINNISDPAYSIVNTNENDIYDSPPDVDVRGGNIRYEIYLSGGRVATMSALPEGRFFRLAMLVDPQPWRFSVSSLGAGFSRVDSYQFRPRISQLDHSSHTYHVTPFEDLRGTMQPAVLVYFRSYPGQEADLSSLPPSRAQDAETPVPVQIMPAVGQLAQDMGPAAASTPETMTLHVLSTSGSERVYP